MTFYCWNKFRGVGISEMKELWLDAGARENSKRCSIYRMIFENLFLHTKIRIDQTRRSIAHDIFVHPRDLRFDKWREQSICNGPIKGISILSIYSTSPYYSTCTTKINVRILIASCNTLYFSILFYCNNTRDNSIGDTHVCFFHFIQDLGR